MTTNRPRPSLIDLFDPLVNLNDSSDTPSTPLRHDATGADKENVNTNSPFGHLTMSMFVNKISKPSPHPQPKPFRRRLVDIGDMTLEDAFCPEALLDESIEDELSACFEHTPDDDDNATLTFRDMVKAATPLRKLKTVPESEVHVPYRMTRVPLADLILEQATSTPLPESNDDVLSPQEPSGITEGCALERVPSIDVNPQGTTKSKLATQSSAAPEDIPLPSSPTIAIQEHLPNLIAVDVTPDQAVPVNTQEPLSCANVDRTICSAPHDPTNCDNANADSACKNGTRIQDVHPSGTEDRIRSEADVHLEAPCFDTSSDDLSPTANISDSTESSDTSSADTSVPAVLSNSSPPSSPMSPSLEPESKLETADMVSPLPLATLRPRPPTMAIDNRMSVDLHASFQMHMQSEEMSFDLLSDKVSFLTAQGGMESFLTTTEDDPSFDLEAERINMEKALKGYSGVGAEELNGVPTTNDHASSVGIPSAPISLADVSNFPSTPSHPASDARQTAGAVAKTIRKRLSIPVAIASPRLIDVSPASKTRSTSISFSPGPGFPIRASQRSPVASSGPVFVPPPAPQSRRKSIHLVTPKSVKESTVPEMPVAVPALKIVKRPRANGHGRSYSTLTITSTTSELERKTSLELTAGSKELGASIVGSFRTRKPIQVQETPERPAAADQLLSASRQKARPRSIAPPRPSLTQTQPSGSSARRVPASEGPQPKSSTVPRSTTLPPPVSGGPRRVLAPSGSGLTSSQPRSSIGTASSLKAPIPAGTATSTSTSSLPKPASRLSLTSRLPAPRTLKAGNLLNLRRAT